MTQENTEMVSNGNEIVENETMKNESEKVLTLHKSNKLINE